jgi:uncharacterized protein (TIGR02145 family)
MKTNVLQSHQSSVICRKASNMLSERLQLGRNLLAKLIVLAIILQLSFSSLDCFSQLSISSTPKTPDNSAILDVSGSTRGVLINRMNTAQRDAITPDANAVSLMIFNTDTKCFEAYVNGGWFTLSCPAGCVPPAAPTAIAAGNVGCSSFTANWNSSPGAVNYYIDVSADNFNTFVSGYNNIYAGNVTSFNVAGLNPNTSYYYRVRAATGCISGNSNGITAVTLSVPSAPTAGTITSTGSSILWVWNTVSGATGYKFNTSNNYSGATDNGMSTSYSQTGLTCNTSYSLYVWAFNACGNSLSGTLTKTTSLCPGPQCSSMIWMANNINSGTRITGGQNQNPGQKWCVNDLESNCTIYGGIYEWTAAMNISSTYLLNYSPYFGTADESCYPCGPTTGHGGVQGICPSGYHVPTDVEWSHYEYCLESTLAPTGSTPLSDFLTLDVQFRGSNSSAGPGAKMKASSPTWDGTNASGFNALPSGYYSNGWSSLGYDARWHTATESYSASLAGMHVLMSGNGQAYRQMPSSKTNGFTVRCLKDW